MRYVFLLYLLLLLLSDTQAQGTKINPTTLLGGASAADQILFSRSDGNGGFEWYADLLSNQVTDTDNQQLGAFSINASKVLSLTLEDGGTQTVNLSSLVDVYTGGVGINVAGTEIQNTGDLSITNEKISTVSITSGNLRIVEGGSNYNLLLSSFVSSDANNAFGIGTDNKFFVNAAATLAPDVQYFDIASGTSTVTTTDFSLPANNDQYQVFRDGAYMTLSEDYTRSGNIITFTLALEAGERVSIHKLF